MKRITILIALFLTLCSYAQAPAPPGMTDEDIINLVDRYYYYPNLEAYYDGKLGVYLYKDRNGTWLETTVLPLTSRGYSLSNGKHVPIKYDGETPYDLIEEHKNQYPANYSSRRQKPEVAVK